MQFTWHKSSYSSGQGGACVEVGVAWRKSTYSGGSGGNCVEVGPTAESIGIRDTKNRAQGQLTVSPETWRAFVRKCSAISSLVVTHTSG